jgi:hypothetical protein
MHYKLLLVLHLPRIRISFYEFILHLCTVSLVFYVCEYAYLHLAPAAVELACKIININIFTLITIINHQDWQILLAEIGNENLKSHLRQF